MRLVEYACKHPAPPLRLALIPLDELAVLLGGNDAGKSSALRAVTRDLSGGHFDDVDEETAKLIGGVFYAELAHSELTDLIHKTASARGRLRNDDQRHPDSSRPPYDPGMWSIPGLHVDERTLDAIEFAVDALRAREDQHSADPVIVEALAASRLVALECAGLDQGGRRVWNAYWCLPALDQLEDDVQSALRASGIEPFRSQRAKDAGERWGRQGSSGFDEVSYGRPSHLTVEAGPVAVVSLGSTSEIMLHRGLAVPAEFAKVRESVTEGVTSLANVIRFARDDVRLDGDRLLPDERLGRLAPGVWLATHEDGSVEVVDGARAACAFISAAANRALPPFVADRYRLRVTLRGVPEWFRLGPVALELQDVADGKERFSVEHVAEGLRLWVQLALLDALEEANRVEGFLWRLASDWFDLARDSSMMYQAFRESAVEDAESDELWDRFDAAVDALVRLEGDAGSWLTGELGEFLAEPQEDDWTRSRGRVGRLFAVDEPERHLQPRLQRQAARWLAETSRTRRAPVLMATHSAPFLALPSEIAKYVLVERVGETTAFREFEPSDVEQLDEIAQKLTFDRGELLGTVSVWLVVEGRTDVVVMQRLFARELHRAGIAVIPLHGTAHWTGVLEADALWRYTRVPVAVMFDQVGPEQVSQLLKASDDELKTIEKQPKTQRPPEVGDMARLIRVARENGRSIDPVPNSGIDMLSHLDEDVLKEVSDGRFPGHEAAEAAWVQYQKGSRDEFFKQRYGLQKRPELFERVAELMAARGLGSPGLAAAVEYCAQLGDGTSSVSAASVVDHVH
jgi:hypothetical protein